MEQSTSFRNKATYRQKPWVEEIEPQMVLKPKMAVNLNVTPLEEENKTT